MLERRLELVAEHLLVEDGRGRRGQWWDYVVPVGRTPAAARLLLLVVLHERLGGRVVIHEGYLVLLSKILRYPKKYLVSTRRATVT